MVDVDYGGVWLMFAAVGGSAHSQRASRSWRRRSNASALTLYRTRCAAARAPRRRHRRALRDVADSYMYMDDGGRSVDLCAARIACASRLASHLASRTSCAAALCLLRRLQNNRTALLLRIAFLSFHCTCLRIICCTLFHAHSRAYHCTCTRRACTPGLYAARVYRAALSAPRSPRASRRAPPRIAAATAAAASRLSLLRINTVSVAHARLTHLSYPVLLPASAPHNSSRAPPHYYHFLRKRLLRTSGDVA